MSYIFSSADSGNDSKNHQHSAAEGFQNNPLCASEEHFKDAPFQPNDDCHDSSICQQGEHTTLRRVWHWSVRNITAIALICLVIGGLVTIIVSFGGWFLWPIHGSALKLPSLIPSKAFKTCTEINWCLSYSRVCACCIGDIAEFVP